MACNAVFRIRIGLGANPDPSFYLNADPGFDIILRAEFYNFFIFFYLIFFLCGEVNFTPSS
jgi:hypothetical protein